MMKFYSEQEFDGHETPEQFRVLSLAYLEGSERLCKELAAGSWMPDFYKGEVVMWLAFHATELFLKACIRTVSTEIARNQHSLGELQEIFFRCFPTVTFNPPFGSEPMLADEDVMKMAVKSDASLHQQLRYPVDKGNAPWSGESRDRSFQPDLFLVALRLLRDDIERISLEVFSKVLQAGR